MSKDSVQAIDEVLCDSGEAPLGIEEGFQLETVGNIGGRALDKACLTNVVVVRVGKAYYVAEYLFEIRKVSKKEARDVALTFGDPCEVNDCGQAGLRCKCGASHCDEHPHTEESR